MQILWKEEKEKIKKGTILTVGVFDGVHVAHRKIIEKVIEKAKEEKLNSVVVSFDKLPEKILKKNIPPLLTTFDEKIKILSNLGVDFLFVYNINKEFLNLSAENFINMLYDDLQPKEIWVGEDHRFGKECSGNVNSLYVLSEKLGFKLKTIDPIKINNTIISSSYIRKIIIEGKVEEATKYLGRPYNIEGVVVRGAGIGTRLGFPTANIQYNKEKLLPKCGVYATKVYIKEKCFNGMTNIGYRPSINNKHKKALSIEVHIFNFRDNIYNEKINIEFMNRLREEIKFSSLQELSIQLKKDKEVALNFLNFKRKH